MSSLPVFPVSFHQSFHQDRRLRDTMIERGKKYVSLAGSHFKIYTGFAYTMESPVVKFHIDRSRIMVDSAAFLRFNPASTQEGANFTVKQPLLFGNSALNGLARYLGANHDRNSLLADQERGFSKLNDSLDTRELTVAYETPQGSISTVRVTRGLRAKLIRRSSSIRRDDKSTAPENGCKIDEVIQGLPGSAPGAEALQFTDEEYLLASPTVLGFSFSDNKWMKFSVANVDDIEWNEVIWNSLILPPKTKDLIQALVVARRDNLKGATDDNVWEKGKGLIG